MPGVALIRPPSAVAWELRAAWARGRRVALTLDLVDQPRLEGIVRAVAATGAYAIVASLHVPLERVLAVHHPSRLGDSTVRAGERWSGPSPAAARSIEAQLRLDPGDT